MRRHACLGLLGVAASVLVACGDDLGPRVPAAIAVTPEAPRIPVARTLQLEAIVVDASGREIPGHTVAFQSSDTTVLTVDDAGLLTSVGSTGGSLITAVSGDLTGEVEAAVVLPPSAIVVRPRSLDLDTGQDAGLDFTVTDENGDSVPGAEVAFQGSDLTIVRVETVDWSDDIIVTGLAVGTATVTLTRGELTAEIPVTVGRFPASVALTPSSGIVLSPGGVQQVTAALLDRTGDEIDLLEPFTWSSSNAAVVTVSPTGVVTSVGAQGSAVITATTDTFTAKLGVFVGTPPVGAQLARVDFPWAAGLAVTADGRYFVSGYGSFASGALPDFALPVTIPIEGQASDVVVDASATRAYLVGVDEGGQRGVVIVDLTTNARAGFIPVSLGYAYAGALSADGSVLTVGSDAGFERFDVASNRSLGGTAVGSVNKLTPHPSRPLLYASGGAGVLELDDKSGAILRRIPGGVNGHIVAPDGKRLYTIGYWPGGVGVWNLDTGAQEPTVGSVYGTDLTISPDGRFLYAIFGSSHIVGNSRLYIVDPASGALLREVILGGLSMRIAMSAEGIAVISNEGATYLEVGWVDFVR